MRFLFLLLLCWLGSAAPTPLKNLDQLMPKLKKGLFNGISSKLGINIGTTPGGNNVVANDVVASNFLDADPPEDIGVAGYEIPDNQDHFILYLYSSSLKTVSLLQPTVTAESEDVTVSIVRQSGPSTLVPYLPDSDSRTRFGGNLTFGLQFECLAESSTTITVNLRFVDHSKGKAPKAESLVLSFVKVCSEEDTGVQGNFMEGLFVGTSSGKTNVVENGEAAADWQIHTRNGRDSTRTTITTDATEFFVSFEGQTGLSVATPFVIIDNEDLLDIALTGAIMAENVILDVTPKSLALQFTCFQLGTTEVTVGLKFPLFPEVQVIWSFSKRCNSLNMFEGIDQIGLSIGLTQGAHDVVADGKTQDLFRNAQSGKEENSKELYVVSDQDDSITFYISSSQASVDIRHPILTVARTYDQELLNIAHPIVQGSIITMNTISPSSSATIKVLFNCLRNGYTDISVQIGIKPEGYLQWVFEKHCSVDPSDEVDDEVEVSAIKGLNIGTARGTANVVKDGIPQQKFHSKTSVRDLKVFYNETQYVTFFITKNTTQHGLDVRLGTPEVISSIQISQPLISGLASSGDLITDSHHSTLTITFHCASPGAAIFNLEIPLLPLSVDQKAPREEPIVISFLKSCPKFNSGPHVGAGGVGIKGFSIGTQKGLDDIVKDGFPTVSYYGQRNKLDPNWESVTIPASSPSTRLYLALVGDDEDEVDSITFQSPLAVTHGHECSPKLSGSAVDGVTLMREGKSYELDITWNCRYRGLGTATISIPIVPHGRITLTIPKQCEGIDRPEGIVLPGFTVGTTMAGSEAVKSGLTQSDFRPYNKNQPAGFIADNDMDITFYVSNAEGPVGALDPVVFSSRSIANPYIEHALSVEDTSEDKDWEDAVKIVIPKTPSPIVVTFNCVSPGTTPMTLIIPVLPRGSQVSITWTVICGGTDFTYGSYLSDDFSWTYYDDSLTSYFFDSSSTWIPSTDYYYSYDEYYTLGEYGTETFFYSDWDDSDENNWNPYVDTQSLYSENAPTGFINVGTGTSLDESHDVVDHGRALDEYAMPLSSNPDTDGLENVVYTVISRAKDSVTVYLSVPRGYQAFFVPSVKAKQGSKGADICTPTLSGAGAYGGNLTSGADSMPLTIDFNCQRPGITPVTVNIPYDPSWRGSASFRMIKVCKSFEATVEWYWTASRIMTLGAVVLLAVASFVGYRYLKDAPESSGYARVNQAEGKTTTTLLPGPTAKNAVDDFDVVDSDSD